MDRFRAPLAFVVAFFMSTGVVLAGAPAVAGERDLEKARAAYDALHYDDVLPLLEQALAQSPTVAERVEILELMGFVHTAFGNAGKAEEAFRALLELRPDFALPPSVSPKIRASFAAAKKKAMDAQRPAETIPTKPGADVPPSGAERALSVDVPATATEPAVYRTWWFWTLIGGGVAVATVATAIGVAAATSNRGPQTSYDHGPYVF